MALLITSSSINLRLVFLPTAQPSPSGICLSKGITSLVRPSTFLPKERKEALIGGLASEIPGSGRLAKIAEGSSCSIAAAWSCLISSKPSCKVKAPDPLVLPIFSSCTFCFLFSTWSEIETDSTLASLPKSSRAFLSAAALVSWSTVWYQIKLPSRSDTSTTEVSCPTFLLLVKPKMSTKSASKAKVSLGLFFTRSANLAKDSSLELSKVPIRPPSTNLAPA